MVPVQEPEEGGVFVPLTWSYDGVADPNLIALARDDGTELLTDVRLAVRAAVEPARSSYAPDVLALLSYDALNRQQVDSLVGLMNEAICVEHSADSMA